MHGCRGNVQKVSQGLMAHFLCRPGAAMKLGAAGADRTVACKNRRQSNPGRIHHVEVSANRGQDNQGQS
jgi:hypothetical protein